MVSKPVVCLNDEPADDDKASEIEECERVPNEIKPVNDNKELWSA